MICTETIYKPAVELHHRSAIKIPDDARQAIERLYEHETHKLSKYVLGQIVQNYAIAVEERRPMWADTGLPRFYVKVGNEARLQGGMVALERELRHATADATGAIPLRPNRVHPLTCKDFNNNLGIHAPSMVTDGNVL
jgi:L(+)-tartrate dehydratase alpha subunit